ncbi:MAG: DNA translocase FtsK [Bacteroidales bacterium]|nr:DNA translocase FtsK [Bacteroidales bacterium]
MNLTDQQKITARRITGLFVAALALFTLLSSASYLFTWKADMSLQTGESMMETGVKADNLTAKLGYMLGKLLVCDWFGIGSFALLVILVVVADWLLRGKSRYSVLKTVVVVLSGTFIASLLLAWISKLFRLTNCFGGGLGGRFGAYVVDWSDNLVGYFTPVLIFLLIVCWLVFTNRKFSEWVGSLTFGQKKEEALAGPEPESELDTEVETAAEPEPIPVPEPVSAPVPTPVAASAPAPQPEEEGGFEVINGDQLSTDIKKPLKRIDMREEEVPNYKMPPLDILDDHSTAKKEVSREELQRNNNKIRAALANYKIQITDVKAVVGPTVTLYKIYPAPGVRIAEIKKLQDDIAMSLNARGVRVVSLEDCVGIEVANDNASIVPLRAMLNDNAFRESKADLPVAIGYTITQKVKVFDLADTPHLLIAGATKQGKSVGLNVIVSSLLYSKHPSELKMVFIDPKMVEFSSYAHLLKHYLAVLPDAADENDERNNAIVKKAKDAERILRSLCIEMDDRYELLSKAYVNNIKLYNDKYRDRHLLPTEGHHFLPYLVVVIDEYADLTMSVGGSVESKAAAKSIQTSIIRLAQKGRAAGIHVILATQRPSVDVISGVIKTNFPTRIAFRVASRIDSQTILDSPGAEKLIGKGDMLFYAGVETERIQCAFVSNDEINAITGYVGSQTGYHKCYNTPYYLPAPAPAEGEAGGAMIDMNDLDEKFEEAARMVVLTQKGSTSDLQRRLGMGYAKAGRVMDQLEAAGIVGPQEGSKPRQVLVPDLDSLNEIIRAYVK